ncbi:hypothetical protein [Mumia zhuanghuii]|uniref:Uncharacterized protein n=1 Tax=Mumia zhuanghuii TaxID=2585211 RepID=A0A5C4LVC5_9ACTN|nr:hypothetical protein [Mumia zhuanghuii]TNC22169.1 hypothetical protein FHE65_35820 [Mumia zhuanghuii]
MLYRQLEHVVQPASCRAVYDLVRKRVKVRLAVQQPERAVHVFRLLRELPMRLRRRTSAPLKYLMRRDAAAHFLDLVRRSAFAARRVRLLQRRSDRAEACPLH